MKNKLISFYFEFNRDYRPGERPTGLIALTVLVMLLTMLAMPVHAAKHNETIWVFGDSLTAPHNSWASQLDDGGYANIKNAARPGLRLVDVNLPDWIVCGNTWGEEHSKVILWLGSNDALQEIDQAWIEREFRDQLQFLEGRGCNVYVILPLNPNGAPPEWVDRFNNVRDTVTAVAAGYPGVELIDINFNWADTLDGLHPTPHQQSWISLYMIHRLGLSDG